MREGGWKETGRNGDREEGDREGGQGESGGSARESCA